MNDAAVPARSVLYLQAKPGMRDELVEVFRRIDIPGNALRQDGCLSVEVQVPPDEDGPLLVTARPTADGSPIPGGNIPGASSRRSSPGKVRGASTTSSSLAATSPPSRRARQGSRLLAKVVQQSGRCRS